MFKKFLILFHTSKSLSYFWNLGSLLGMVLVFQIFTGFFLSMYYINDSFGAFESIQYIMYEVNFGWLFRILHFNGASFFFIVMYLHFFKGLYFFSYRMKYVWFVGMLLMLLFMLVAFLGYVMVWSQMSYWACVVITSLLSVIPFFGFDLVFLVWGGFSVSGVTLKFFFVLHFLLPWIGFFLVFLHLFFLHETGSTSNLYCFIDVDQVNFFPFYFFKDLVNVVFFNLFFFLSLSFPFFLGDPEMFLEANFLVSPSHIVPEWYFLFAYAILRCVPNKTLGVVLMFFSILVYFVFLFLDLKLTPLDNFNMFLVFSLFLCLVFLSWLGQCSMEYPYVEVSAYVTFFYFFFVFLIFFCCLLSYIFL